MRMPGSPLWAAEIKENDKKKDDAKKNWGKEVVQESPTGVFRKINGDSSGLWEGWAMTTHGAPTHSWSHSDGPNGSP